MAVESSNIEFLTINEAEIEFDVKDATGRFYPEALDFARGKNAHSKNIIKQILKLILIM